MKILITTSLLYGHPIVSGDCVTVSSLLRVVTFNSGYEESPQFQEPIQYHQRCDKKKAHAINSVSTGSERNNAGLLNCCYLLQDP